MKTERVTIRLDPQSYTTLIALQEAADCGFGQVIMNLAMNEDISKIETVEIKSFSFTMRISPTQRLQLDRLAKKYGVDVAELVRRLLRAQGLAQDELVSVPTTLREAWSAWQAMKLCRMTANRHAQRAAVATQGSYYCQEHAAKAQVYENRANDWFNAIEGWLKNEDGITPSKKMQSLLTGKE